MEIRGDLTEGVLPGVLRSLYVGRRTGLLHVTRGEERGSVCFIQGNIVYGESTIRECRMGEVLVRHALLTQWDLDRAAEMVSVTGRRLGEVLVQLGLLDGDGLEDALALHVREVLLTIFSWRDGAYFFDEHDPTVFRGYDRPLRLSTGEVILDAVWSITDPDVIRYALGDLERVLTLASDPLLRFQRIALSPTDGFILSRVDGTLTASEILRMAPVSTEEAQRSLVGLIYTGMVEFLPETPATTPIAVAGSAFRKSVLEACAHLPNQDHFDVLGLERTATANEIHAAYFRMAKLFHPDSHHEPGLIDLRDKLETLFSRATEAHRVLWNPEARAAYEASRRPASGSAGSPSASGAPTATSPQAAEAGPTVAPDAGKIDETLDRAQEALGAGRYWDALASVDEVLAASTGRARRRARVLKAQALLKGEGGRRAAEEELKAALEEDRGNIEAHFTLGNIYRSGGANALAAAAFQRVLALKPRHAGALQALASLEGAPAADAPLRASSKISGFRKKLFGGS
jgi:curved DNA-binding protein CbpA